MSMPKLETGEVKGERIPPFQATLGDKVDSDQLTLSQSRTSSVWESPRRPFEDDVAWTSRMGSEEQPEASDWPAVPPESEAAVVSEQEEKVEKVLPSHKQKGFHRLGSQQYIEPASEDATPRNRTDSAVSMGSVLSAAGYSYEDGVIPDTPTSTLVIAHGIDDEIPPPPMAGGGCFFNFLARCGVSSLAPKATSDPEISEEERKTMDLLTQVET